MIKKTATALILVSRAASLQVENAEKFLQEEEN